MFKDYVGLNSFSKCLGLIKAKLKQMINMKIIRYIVLIVITELRSQSILEACYSIPHPSEERNGYKN